MHAHAQWAEVAPLVPLAVDLGAIAALLFCIGCVYVLRGFLQALLGALSSVVSVIPGIGGVTAGVIHSAERAVAAALGNAESYFDAKLGLAFHELARLVDWTYREIKSHANLIYTLAAVAFGQSAAAALRAFVAQLHSRIGGVVGSITHLYSRVLSLEHRFAHLITAGVLPRLGRLEREYDHIIDRDIAGLRSRAKEVERGLSDVWDYVRSHPWTVVTDAFVGAVAVALGKLGLNWIRCPSANSFFNKRGCNAWSDLEGLLAAAVGIAASLSLVELAKAEQEIVGDLSTVVRDFWQV